MPLPQFTHYARRLLNPFRGTAQIVQTEQARAVSTDGLRWRIQIQHDIYRPPWSSLAIPAQQQHFVYGVWSPHEGLTRLPIHPSLYQAHVEEAVVELTEVLSTLQDSLPFALQDRFELWLFDAQHNKPLALLASSTNEEAIGTRGELAWYPAAHGESGFASDAVTATQQGATPELSAADMLENMVRQRPAVGYWIAREADLSGIILQDHRGQTQRRDEILKPESFPAYLLADNPEDMQASRLIADYHAWQAPLLLMLPLGQTQRRQLEPLAARQPLQVHRYHRLYPAIYNKELIKKTLVEAVIRRAQHG